MPIFAIGVRRDNSVWVAGLGNPRAFPDTQTVILVNPPTVFLTNVVNLIAATGRETNGALNVPGREQR